MSRTPADFASASEKIWPHFAAAGCLATSKVKLIEMGIIRKVSGVGWDVLVLIDASLIPPMHSSVPQRKHRGCQPNSVNVSL